MGLIVLHLEPRTHRILVLDEPAAKGQKCTAGMDRTAAGAAWANSNMKSACSVRCGPYPTNAKRFLISHRVSAPNFSKSGRSTSTVIAGFSPLTYLQNTEPRDHSIHIGPAQQQSVANPELGTYRQFSCIRSLYVSPVPLYPLSRGNSRSDDRRSPDGRSPDGRSPESSAGRFRSRSRDLRYQYQQQYSANRHA